MLCNLREFECIDPPRKDGSSCSSNDECKSFNCDNKVCSSDVRGLTDEDYKYNKNPLWDNHIQIDDYEGPYTLLKDEGEACSQSDQCKSRFCLFDKCGPRMPLPKPNSCEN